jgi:hypothetical protein
VRCALTATRGVDFRGEQNFGGSCHWAFLVTVVAKPFRAVARKVAINSIAANNVFPLEPPALSFDWIRTDGIVFHRVGLHNSCGTLRRLGHARPSELHEPFFSKPLDLLSKVEGIQFVTPARPDECCGFGGTFSVFEEVVST